MTFSWGAEVWGESSVAWTPGGLSCGLRLGACQRGSGSGDSRGVGLSLVLLGGVVRVGKASRSALLRRYFELLVSLPSVGGLAGDRSGELS